MNHRNGFVTGLMLGLAALLCGLPGAPAVGQLFIIQVPRDYTDINAAIAAAGPTGQVVISPGVYDRSSQTFPIVVPDNLIMKGAGTHQTIIDGTGHTGPLLQVNNMTSTNFGLRDFTVRHANNPSSNSAALHLRNCSAMTIQNLRFFSNDAPAGAGAAMFIQNSSPTITNTDFRDNAAQFGGAVCLEGAASDPSFTLCTFKDNRATSHGGALMIRGDALGAFDQCQFESNRAGNNGGAMHVTSTTGLGLGDGPAVTFSRFFKNAANIGGGINLENHWLQARSCEFLENDGTTNGGAISSDGASRIDLDRSHIARNTVGQHIVVLQGAGDITNNIFYRNTTGAGGVLRFEGPGVTARVVHNTFAYNNIGGPITTGIISQFQGTPEFVNNIVAFNDAVGYAEADFNSDPIFSHNLFWANTDGGYLDEGISLLETPAQFLVISNPQPAVGMVIADPDFRDPGVNHFHLNAASPAINAGQAAAAAIAPLDIDLEDRTGGLAGGAPDMGADEVLAPRLVTSAFWFDKVFDGFANEGDELVLQFSEPMQINAPLIGADFTLPVTDDTLGTTPTAVVNTENPTQVVITLSAGAMITPGGTFSDTALTTGSASGIELASSPRVGVLVSARTGLEARRVLTGSNARDITVPMEPNNATFNPDPIFPQSLLAGPGGYFTKNRLDFPAGSLQLGVTLLLAPQFEFAGALAAMQVSQVAGTVAIDPAKPAKITMQYEPLELNAESEEFEKRLRIFVRKQNLFGQYEFRPVEDSLGGIQQVDTGNNTISVFTDELIPQDIVFAAAAGDGEVAVQANTLAVYVVAPLDVVPADSELISPSAIGAGDPIKSSVIIEPGKNFDPLPEVYYNHQIDLPNFDADALSSYGVTLQTAANRFERDELERTGLPGSNFSVTEIISWENDPANRLEFLDVGHLRQQYISHPEIDLRDARGYTASPNQLELLLYDPQDGFIPPASGTPQLNGQSSTFVQQNLLNPAPGGRGIYALIANAAKAFAYTFDQGEEGWRQQDAPRFFITPDFIAGGGRLGLGSRGFNSFGAWLGPENIITAQPDVLLKTRFTVSSDTVDPSLVPSMRVRMNAENLDSAIVMQLISDPSGTGYPAGASTVDYFLFFEPPYTAIGGAENANGVGVAFDLTHLDPFDNHQANVFLEHFETEYLDKKAFDAGFSVARDYTFLFNAEGWVNSGQIGQLTAPQAGYDFANDALFLQATNSLTFGFWTTDSGVAMQPNTLYCVTFWIFTNEPASGNGVPTFRLRVSDGISASQTLEINSATGNYSPLTIPQPYQIYYYPPADLAATGRTLILGFDILNLNPFDSTATRIYLDRALIEQKAY